MEHLREEVEEKRSGEKRCAKRCVERGDVGWIMTVRDGCGGQKRCLEEKMFDERVLKHPCRKYKTCVVCG